MRAVGVLAKAVGDNTTLAADAAASAEACTATISTALWHETGPGTGFWRAWQTAAGDAPNVILSGALHGQSWANFLGLGLVLPAANITAHVRAETALNCNYSQTCELGLLACPGRDASWSYWASPSMVPQEKRKKKGKGNKEIKKRTEKEKQGVSLFYFFFLFLPSFFFLISYFLRC